MSALTESGSVLSEFAGDYKVFATKLTGTAASGTLTVEGMASISAVQACLAGQATVDCNGVCVTGISGNVITFQTLEPAGDACTQNPVNFYVLVIGK